jgi:hypothetical protein
MRFAAPSVEPGIFGIVRQAARTQAAHAQGLVEIGNRFAVVLAREECLSALPISFDQTRIKVEQNI